MSLVVDEAIGPALPAIGDVVDGKYVLEDLLGEGGMGAVFGARHVKLGQRLALKFLLPDQLQKPAVKERFLREAKAAVAITSDHVTRVLDVGELGGLPYMVMEFLEGGDLGSVVDHNGPISIERAAGYVLEASEAIAEAHALGIVHRDIKPSNLFLTDKPDGTKVVKVLDFGIAKSVTEDANAGKLTSTNQSVGSPQYMSPEQVRDSRTADERSDVWALGVVLYELVTGSPPFTADAVPALCAKILTDAAPKLYTVKGDVPKPFDDVVQRCLAKDPDDRYQSVDELARALAPFCPGAQASIDQIARTSAARRFPQASRTSRQAISAEATTIAASAVTGPHLVQRKSRLPMWIGAAVVAAGLVVVAVVGLGSKGTADTASAADGTTKPATQSTSAPPVLAATSALSASTVDPDEKIESATASPSATPDEPVSATPTAKRPSGATKPRTSATPAPTTNPVTKPTSDPYGDRK